MRVVKPDWPAPGNVHSMMTTRSGGISVGCYDSLNLADHVGDDPARVAENRQRLVDQLGLPAMPQWLRQVHGARVLRIPADAEREADGAVTTDLVLEYASLEAETGHAGEGVGYAHERAEQFLAALDGTYRVLVDYDGVAT